ncbi:MAG: MerR family transcriptional regulator [Candidatus Cryptobacteroides sp.]
MEDRKYLYTIGELADILGENVSLVRFWSNEFAQFVHPKRNAKGNRLFTAEDVDTFRQIHLLVKVEGLTLAGASKRLRADMKGARDKTRILDSLKAIREQLYEVRSSL